jgi:RNA polymerase sigma-70 factor (ECF subfamily)
MAAVIIQMHLAPRSPGGGRVSFPGGVDERAEERAEDAALMTAIAERADRAAFARLFQAYAPKVKAHLVARGAASGVADELVQDVMLVVWRKAALFDAARGSLATWLYTISRNCLLNHVRHERRLDIEVDVPEPAPVALGDSEDAMLAAAGRRKLAATIAKLPAEQLEVLHRAYWRGQTMQECADEQGIPLGTVKTRVRLALGRLRELMQDTRGRSDE